MKRRLLILLPLVALSLVLLQNCKPEKGMDGYEAGEEYAGGTSTIFDFSENAFNHASPALTGDDETKFSVGNSFFRSNWVIAPSSTTGRDGLGPMYNALGCSGCHLKDGRGRAPIGNEGVTGLLFRLSLPGTDAHGGPMPDPVYGGQFQNLAIPGVSSEGNFSISYQTLAGTYEDGTPYTLQNPQYTLNGNFGPLSGLLISPRVAQQMCGLGLLAGIRESDLLFNVDESDANADGISGKANYVWDYKNQTVALGRFGWKANQPNLYQQTAGAFNGDVGITSSLFPSDHCTSAEMDCMNAPNGNDSGYTYELSDYQLDRVVYYASTLAVPGHRNAKNEDVLAGKKLFKDAGCAKCHIPSYTTGINNDIPQLSNQKIFPYTDLLLHDMGDGLADNRPDYLATGKEWRTPPLWGIGMFYTVNGHTNYLHDGRAQNLEEAILWHGGEGENAKENFRKMNSAQREKLILFLKSL
ncbi:MAG: di-heme oxidoredictase family protein [Chitinophagales bacterium]